MLPVPVIVARSANGYFRWLVVLVGLLIAGGMAIALVRSDSKFSVPDALLITLVMVVVALTQALVGRIDKEREERIAADAVLATQLGHYRDEETKHHEAILERVGKMDGKLDIIIALTKERG